MGKRTISRARFLAGGGALGVAAAVGALGATGGLGTAGAGTRTGAGTGAGSEAGTGGAGAGGGGLTHRGVLYECVSGESPATGWSARRMRRDLRVIRDELHATSVGVFGDGVERLAATATEAAERGLRVWLQPRLADRPKREILDHLAETGRVAERLRRQGADVHLSVGCEFLLFVPGIVPGDNVLERIENVLDGNFDPELMQRRLTDFIERSTAVGRSVFGGPLTYGAAHGDEVDWDLFDVVSVDYYEYHPDRSGYAADLAPYRRWGKPVAITECGTCTYEGAPRDGGMGWYSVDYTKEPAEIRGDLVRSERTQAEYLAEVLDVYESMNLYAALVYSFVSPDSPHSPDPRYDLDMASYSLTKPIREDFLDPAAGWHWEPKEAFHAVAERFARAARR
ncbi:abortive phage infection protein [Streptomyces sp. B6B3]|uniref:abortive phage infection protein n=1 Tax=Streptomyces sp. B6B3 TaxID=3153570 RepID=UPI00325F164D